MAHLVKVEPNKTYASEANAIKAVEKRLSNTSLRYFITCTPDGRFFPVFLGQEAMQHGVHFLFNVVV